MSRANQSAYFILLCAFLSGCATKILVKSDPPETVVNFVIPETQEHRPIGMTPLELTSQKIDEYTRLAPNNTGFVELVLEKEGFQTQSILIPYNRLFGHYTEVNLQMLTQRDLGGDYRQLVQYLVNAQQFINDGQFERAEAETRRALKIDSKFIFAHLLLGHSFYLRHDYVNGLKCYERALEIDPTNREAQRMITRARVSLGRTSEMREPANAPAVDQPTESAVPMSAAEVAPVEAAPAAAAPSQATVAPHVPTRLPARKKRQQ
jgi:tetratricopeptide (TPR) repeat protein